MVLGVVSVLRWCAGRLVVLIDVEVAVTEEGVLLGGVPADSL